LPTDSLKLFVGNYLEDASAVAIRPGVASTRRDAGRILAAALRATRLRAAFDEARLGDPRRARLAGAVADRARAAARLATGDLIDGDTTVAAWHRQMAAGLAASHRAATMAWLGRRTLADAEEAALARLSGLQLQYLDAFAAAVRSGQQELDGTALSRAGLYGNAAWAVAQGVAEAGARERGMDEGRSVLGYADHCPGCLSEAGRGWQPIGALIPIGGRECKANCGCYLIFR
jgi:hypothetical protein